MQGQRQGSLDERFAQVIHEGYRDRHTYACWCSALNRQDCYCWDRRPRLSRSLGFLAIAGFLGGFWYSVIGWVTRL